MSELDNMGEILSEFLAEASEIVEDLSEKFLELEKKKDNEELINEIFRSVHTLKGSSGFLGIDKLAIVAHKTEDILNKYRRGESQVTTETTDIMLESLDIMTQLVNLLKDRKDISDFDIKPITDKLVKFSENMTSSDKDFSEEKQQVETTKVVAKPEKDTISETDTKVEETVDESQESSIDDDDDSPEYTDEYNRVIFEGEMAEIIDDFIIETTDVLEKLDNNLLNLEENSSDLNILNEVFRHVHTIKGTGSFLGFDLLAEVTHIGEDVLNMLRKEELTVTDTIMDVLLEFNDILKLLLGDIANKKLVKRDVSPIVKKLKAIKKGDKVPDVTPVEVKDKPKDIKKEVEEVKQKPIEKEEKSIEEPSKVKRSVEQTIRVDVKRLELLLNLVGELVLGRNRLQQVTDDLMISFDEDNPLIQELYRVNGEIAQISSSIQDAVMKTRMVAIGKVFNKFPRMVRDLSRSSGKSVELLISGAETELDKTLVEEINDPLVHLIRNSIDHGVELPEDRASSGKPEKGIVHIFARQEGDNIVVGIEDDGKGIDPDIIKNKAIERELITAAEAEKLTKREILNFIFQPGFSTAKKVTNISGRGVGMDVVKTNISKLNGHIDIDSEVGEGTKFIIRLPLTLAIIPGLLVNFREDIYVIPISSVIEITKLEEGMLKSVNRKEVMLLRNEVIPLIRFNDVYQMEGYEERDVDLVGKFVVILASAEKRFGLIVDSVKEGQAEVVIKKLGSLVPHIKGIAGGTIMGDGKVRFILDVQEMIESVSRKN